MSYTDLTGVFVYRDILPWNRMDALAENDNYDHFPSGTVAFFYQTTVPAGWTKLTSHDDKALRVVSGAGGGSGGTNDFSQSNTLAHTHSGASHAHVGYDHFHNLDVNGSSAALSLTVTDAVSMRISGGNLKFQNASGVGAADHAIAGAGSDVQGADVNTTAVAVGTTNSQLTNFQYAYADVIMGSKDA